MKIGFIGREGKKHTHLPLWYRMVMVPFYCWLGVKVLVTGQIQSIKWSEDEGQS